MKLSAEKENILNKRYESIVAYVRSRFKGGFDLDDIVQEAIIAYSQALSESDLSSNYHSYCMTRAKWGALKQLKRQQNRSLEIRIDCSENDQQLLNHGIYAESNVNSGSINPVTLCTVLEKVYVTYQELKPSHRELIDRSYWGRASSKVKTGIIKERRGRDIKKTFLAQVLKGLENDVGFCESGLFTTYNTQTH